MEALRQAWMQQTGRELLWSSALVEALIASPGRDLPDASEVDLSVFWQRLSAAAPLHLMLGWRVATVLLVVVLPRLLGHSRSLVELTAEERDAALQRANRWPVFTEILEVAKIVACFAYFDDERVQTIVRGREA